MSRKRVSSPAEVVKAGDVVRVLVVALDVPRQRIGLSMRLDDPIDHSQPTGGPRPGGGRVDPRHMQSKPTVAPGSDSGGMLADAFRRAADRTGRRA